MVSTPPEEADGAARADSKRHAGQFNAPGKVGKSAHEQPSGKAEAEQARDAAAIVDRPAKQHRAPCRQCRSPKPAEYRAEIAALPWQHRADRHDDDQRSHQR